MQTVSTKQHHWVKHTITPVLTLTDDEGQPVVFVDPDAAIIAEDHAVYGCDDCGQAMCQANMNTECEGEDEDA